MKITFILVTAGLLAVWAFRGKLQAMKSAAAVAVVGTLVAFILGIVSFSLEDQSSFTSNLLLNIVAEAVGLTATAVIGLLFARRMLHEVAPALMRLIKRLREGKTITAEAAQAMVVLSVQLLFQDALKKERSSIAGERQHKACSICSLPYLTEPTSRGVARCLHCKLPGKYWQLEESDGPTSKMSE